MSVLSDRVSASAAAVSALATVITVIVATRATEGFRTDKLIEARINTCLDLAQKEEESGKLERAISMEGTLAQRVDLRDSKAVDDLMGQTQAKEDAASDDRVNLRTLDREFLILAPQSTELLAALDAESTEINNLRTEVVSLVDALKARNPSAIAAKVTAIEQVRAKIGALSARAENACATVVRDRR